MKKDNNGTIARVAQVLVGNSVPTTKINNLFNHTVIETWACLVHEFELNFCLSI